MSYVHILLLFFSPQLLPARILTPHPCANGQENQNPHGSYFSTLVRRSLTRKTACVLPLLACVQQTHFRSSLLSPRKIGGREATTGNASAALWLCPSPIKPLSIHTILKSKVQATFWHKTRS